MLLKLGSKGPAVREIQSALGLNPDGIFGPYTEAAVKRYQQKNGLAVDGIVGPQTYNNLIQNDTDLDTDRFGYDDSIPDTDNKIKHLDPYTTDEGLKIHRAYLDTDEYVRDYGKIKPVNLIIHDTAGWDNPYNTIASWNRDKRGRVCTQYCIGGLNIRGNTKHDGEVVECFPDNYLGWHTGNVGDWEHVAKLSVGIEINNFGRLTEKNGKFYNYVNYEVPSEQVVTLEKPHRGYLHYHKYSEKQIENLRLLILHIQRIHPTINISNGLPALLKLVDPFEAFEFNDEAYYGRTRGLWTHTNVRKDKNDCSPQPLLVDILKTFSK